MKPPYIQLIRDIGGANIPHHWICVKANHHGISPGAEHVFGLKLRRWRIQSFQGSFCDCDFTAHDRGTREKRMARTTYTVARHIEGGWSVEIHGRVLRYETRDEAVRCAMIAGKTETLCGNDGLIAIERDDGTFRAEFIH
ncbi:hypothetical protein HL653_05805 [Sphingomonas sp. AP4-R1]|uniref:hypothetical protein n=1 Tax=Sphingomonas sp. AP4-R1 TaxID=2735134 RepID=UPI0014939DA3|nr:hypothetical protein [Sphingomonas sp. AP4-R1]QJU57369.1 hypothetical protein HL653_05805 [Sphingomonas sp. AP4-R1]